MVSDISGALVDGTGIDQLNRIGDSRVQALSAWARDVSKQCLTDKFMAEGKWPLRAFGAGDDHSHPLRLLDDVEKFVNIDLANRAQKLKAETAADHRCCRQRTQIIYVHSERSIPLHC